MIRDFCVSLIMLCVAENISKQDSSVDVEQRQGGKFICHGMLPAGDGHVFLFFLFSPTTVKPPFSHLSSIFCGSRFYLPTPSALPKRILYIRPQPNSNYSIQWVCWAPPDTSTHSPWLDRVYCCRASSTNFAQLLYLQRTVSNAKQVTLEILAFSILSVDSVNTTV